MELGGNIELAGFKDIDGGNMIIVKKMVGNFVTDVTEADPKFQRLVITLKKVHEREDHQIFELQAKLSAKEVYNSEVDDRNLLIGFDKLLKKLTAQIEHSMHA